MHVPRWLRLRLKRLAHEESAAGETAGEAVIESVSESPRGSA